MPSPPDVRRHDLRILPDAARVIARPFVPGGQAMPDGRTRVEVVLERLAEMSDDEVTTTLDQTLAHFAGRHRVLDEVLERSLAAVDAHQRLPTALTPERRALIGAYFSHEYAIEAAALGNPSMVPAPSGTSARDGTTPFVMSLRAVGEGHISSIVFRRGVVGADGAITLDVAPRQVETGRWSPARYDRSFFAGKLEEMGAASSATHDVLAELDPTFTRGELDAALAALRPDDHERDVLDAATRRLVWIAESNYQVVYPDEVELGSRVLFPMSPTETNGMEDARLVRFADDDGSATYYGTYTAFDGTTILPQLIETRDFASFRIATLGGACAQNKGIALFPRRLGGQYVALARHDNVNNFLMVSDDVRVWTESELIQEPKRHWELVQLGNCGSPLETEAGWLVITHGVGPFRQYSLGALLLDLDDPSRVIGHLPEPLLVPTAQEREGYVPNVVYSCGGMIAGDRLVLPYGFADRGAGIVSFDLAELVERVIDGLS